MIWTSQHEGCPSKPLSFSSLSGYRTWGLAIVWIFFFLSATVCVRVCEEEQTVQVEMVKRGEEFISSVNNLAVFLK